MLYFQRKLYKLDLYNINYFINIIIYTLFTFYTLFITIDLLSRKLYKLFYSSQLLLKIIFFELKIKISSFSRVWQHGLMGCNR